MEENPSKPVDAAEANFLSGSYNFILGNGPKHTIIEKVAGEFAGVYYDAARASGMTSKFKSAKMFARKNFEKFIPRAVATLTDMLGRQDLPELMKAEIYDAIIERANDPTLQHLTVQGPNEKPMFNWSGGKNPFEKRH